MSCSSYGRTRAKVKTYSFVTKQKEREKFVSPLFTLVAIVDRYYFACCSKARVLVGWSHTSDGPKYWIGPG